MQGLGSAIDRLLDTYVAFLEAEDIELLESLRRTKLMSLFPQITLLDVNERLQGRGAPALVLGHDLMIAELRVHVALVLSLIGRINQFALPPVTITDLHLWRNDVSPLIGSARFESIQAKYWVQRRCVEMLGVRKSRHKRYAAVPAKERSSTCLMGVR